MTITTISPEKPEFFKRDFLPTTIFYGAIAAAILIGLYMISLQNFILFHGIVELAGIAVAFSIFIIVWNTRRYNSDAFFLIVGISFLFIGGIDLVHTLAYKGMGVFPGNNSDLPTQLWIAARYFQSITFFIATLFIGRSITGNRNNDAGIIVAACSAASTLLIASIFVWQIFPQNYTEGIGLTPFKILSEYIISLILIVTIGVLYLKRDHFDSAVWKYLIAAQVFLLLGEMAFTSYISVFGFMNMLGHLFRLVSVYLFYRAFVVIALTRPFDLLLRELKENEHVMDKWLKELNCLYGISALLELPGIATNEIMARTATLLPPAFRFPEIAEARIVLDGQTFQTARFRETPWMLARQILVNDKPVGKVEVCYLEARPPIDEGPFRTEERHLLNAVAERMGRVIERIWAEEALQSSERKYHTLFENMLEGFAYCQMLYDDKGEPVDWVYLAVNKAFEKMTGLEDVTGKRVLEVIPNVRELTPELFNTYGRVALTGIPETFDINFTPLNMWLRVSVFSPEKSCFVAVFDDVTKRREAEDEIRKARDFYLKILDDFPNPIWRADVNAKCDYFNRDWLEFTGRTLEQELGDGWVEGVHPDDLERCLKIYLDNFHARKPFEMEYRLRYHDGTYHWLYDSGKPFHSDDGVFAGYIGSCYDIQDRRKAEEALREKTEELDQYFTTSLDLFCIADTEGYFRRLNKEWEKALGYSVGDLEGERFLNFVHPDDLPGTLAAIADLSSQIEVINFTNRYRHKNGTYRWIEWRSFPKGNRIFAAARDITDRKLVEEALRESEEKYRTLVESSFDGIAIHQQGILVYVNRTAARLLGSEDPRDFIGKPAISVVAPAFRKRMESRVEQAPEKVLGLVREQFLRLDGTPIDVDVTTVPSTWEGRPAAYVTFRDITTQVRTENALRESEEKYRSIINEMQDIFYRTDLSGKITMLSPSAARLAGYDSNDQLLGRDVSSVYVDPAGRDNLLSALKENGSVYAYPLDLKVRDGSIRHVTTSSHFYRDPQGTIIGVEGVIHDITEQQRAEDALRESEERYRTVIENIQDVYFRFDRENRLVMVSPSAAPTFGFATHEEMLGRPALAIWKDIKARERMIETMKNQGGFVQDWEAEFVKSDGTVFWGSVSGRMHTDKQGEFSGTEGIIRNISERKKMEAALKGALTKLNMLSSITRHDILNQITGLRTFLELSREDLKGTPHEKFIEKEDLAAEAIQRQIEFTRFYQDIGVNASRWQDVREVAKDAVAQLSIQAIDVQIAFGGVEIFADPLIVKVFFNLMENSLRHGGQVTQMSFSSRESDAGLIISYEDNGVGISAEDKKKLFQKGFGKHTGLGLFLSREILAITGITITENGDPGRGVRFEMIVPPGAYRLSPGNAEK